jgi:uncharacterized integral membrane protein
LVLALLVAVVLAVQNTVVIDVSLLLWHFQASLPVIMVVCVVVGLLMGLLALAPRLYRGRKHARKLARHIAELKNSNGLPVRSTVYPHE